MRYVQEVDAIFSDAASTLLKNVIDADFLGESLHRLFGEMRICVRVNSANAITNALNS